MRVRVGTVAPFVPHHVPRARVAGLVGMGVGPVQRGDLDNEHGNWFLANQQMLAALNWANAHADETDDTGPRYTVRHEWGDGAHSDAHGGMLLPQVLRWMFSR